jgi:tetratricopeptide (TPR) repeat protein
MLRNVADFLSSTAASAHRFPVFLSSLCRGAPHLQEFRAKIYDEIGQKSLIYVDEEYKRRDIPNQIPLETVDEILERVREADTFICILAGSNHGTAIEVGGIRSSTSFFEIELYQATLLQKDIHVLVRNDFEPELKLAALLALLKEHFASWQHFPKMDSQGLESAIKQIVEQSHARGRKKSWPSIRTPISKLIQAFYEDRGKGREVPSIFFLDGITDSTHGEPKLDVIRLVAESIDAQSNEEKKLTRLWIGLRELMASDIRTLRDEELLKHWNSLLSHWARSGAWYKLHGDMYLGCLAALNSLALVRGRIASLYPGTTSLGEIGYPGGALASAKYSIAKHLYIRRDRIARLKEANSDISRSLEVEEHDKSGLLAIRGSILRQLGHTSACVKVYETVLQIRRERNAPANVIGEALSELGYAQLRNCRFRRGLRLCEEGVERLREDVRPGFLARGLRKLAVAYLLNGKIWKAYEARRQARDVAVHFGLRDQMS